MAPNDGVNTATGDDFDGGEQRPTGGSPAATTPARGDEPPTAEWPEVSDTPALDAPDDEPGADPDEPTQQRPGRGGLGVVAVGRGCLLSVLAVFAALTLVLVGTKALGLWPEIHNPFAKQQTDRSQPPLLESIQDLSRFTAAQGTFQVVIDLQNNRKYVPDFLINERTLFVAAGTVDAYVDFSAIGSGAVRESADHTEVTISLPAPQLEKANLDLEHSYVFAEERGLLNRVGDFFNGDANRQKEVYQLAEQRIATAATDTELAQRAQENTRKMLEGLLKSLGYERVTITFTAP